MDQHPHTPSLLDRGLGWLYGAPLPADPPEATHRLRLLLITSVITSSFTLIVLLSQLTLWFGLLPGSAPLSDIFIDTVLVVTTAVTIWCSRRGRVQAGAHLLILALLVYLALQLYQDGAPSANLNGAQTAVLTIVLAHLLIGPRTGWVVFGIATASIIVLELCWHAGYLPTPVHDRSRRALFAILAWAISTGIIVLIVNSMFGMLRQHTELLEKQVQERTAELRASEQWFRTLYEHSPDAVLLFETQTWTIVDCNETACLINGYTREELIGAPIALLNPPELTGTPDTYLHLLRQGETLRFEIEHIRKDGTRFPVAVSNSLVIIEGRELVLGVDRDITRQKLAEQALRQALTAEIEVNLLRSRMLSIASHDLRTPLAAIQMTCDLLCHYGDELSDARREAEHQRLRNIIQRMADLLDEIFASARTTSDEVDTTPQSIDLVAFCKELIAEHRRADREQHTITLEVRETPFTLTVNRGPLHLVIANLLSNALKYSPAHSEVTVSLLFSPVNVTLTIADQGIGIPAEDRAKLFIPFYRASNVGQTPGTGLGLSIVQQSLLLLDGTITVESVQNEGTTVTIILPRTAAPAPTAP